MTRLWCACASSPSPFQQEVACRGTESATGKASVATACTSVEPHAHVSKFGLVLGDHSASPPDACYCYAAYAPLVVVSLYSSIFILRSRDTSAAPTEMANKVGPRVRELAYAARGSQDADPATKCLPFLPSLYTANLGVMEDRYRRQQMYETRLV